MSEKKQLEILESLLLGIKDKITEACKELQKIRYLPTNEILEKQQPEEPFLFPTKEETAEDEGEGDIPF